MLRRRRLYFIAPFLIITVVATLAAFMLPKEYESSTTILHQGDWVLNPLVRYTMAVSMEAGDQLRDFNEIIYSTPIIKALIDSLGIQHMAKSAAEEQRLIKNTTSKIKTVRKSFDSFTISYFSRSPETAQKAVRVLSELYIQTRSRVNNNKNNFAVQFYGQKLNSLRNKFEQSQQALVSEMKRHVSDLPESDRESYSQIDDYNKQIAILQNEVANYQQALVILQRVLASGGSGSQLKSLYEIPSLNVPYGNQIEAAVESYEGLLHEYTDRYPGVQDSLANLLQLVGTTKDIIRSGLSKKEAEIWTLEKHRNTSIAAVQEATVAQSRDQDLKSNFEIYQGLYKDMEVKLEQAQTSRDLGKNQSKQFVVLDPPGFPTSPAKPHKGLMIAGGFSVGLILGILFAGLAELVDTRIRTSTDVEMYNKPVIAYLPLEESYQKHGR